MQTQTQIRVQIQTPWEIYIKSNHIITRHLNFGNLGAHLHQSHGIKMRDYQVWIFFVTSLFLFGHQEKFGEPEITRKSYHECGICHETLLFIRWQLLAWNLNPSAYHVFTSRYHLTMHVKNKHGLTIGEYNKKHMQVCIHNIRSFCNAHSHWVND